MLAKGNQYEQLEQTIALAKSQNMIDDGTHSSLPMPRNFPMVSSAFALSASMERDDIYDTDFSQNIGSKSTKSS
jgi:hypothetical protein